LAGSIPIFKKIQNGIILAKKTKVNGLQPGFARSTRRVGRVTPGHDFFYFFINSTQFQPQIDRIPGQAGFQNNDFSPVE